MKIPIVGVTGPIASGKSSVARVIASRKGALLLDCDRLARRALEDITVKRRLVEAFGRGILSPSGKISRRRLRELAFSSSKCLRILDRIVRPQARHIIEQCVEKARFSKGIRYIVLDAVLLFQYRFAFDIDLSISVLASEETRAKRLMERDRICKEEAERMIALQRHLERDWLGADIIMDGEPIKAQVERKARRIRDAFIEKYCGARK